MPRSSRRRDVRNSSRRRIAGTAAPGAGELWLPRSARRALPEKREGSLWAPRQKWDEGLRNLFQSGLRLYRQGRYAEAIAYFEAMVAQDAENPEALELLNQARQRLSGSPISPNANSLADATQGELVELSLSDSPEDAGIPAIPRPPSMDLSAEIYGDGPVAIDIVPDSMLDPGEPRARSKVAKWVRAGALVGLLAAAGALGLSVFLRQAGESEASATASLPPHRAGESAQPDPAPTAPPVISGTDDSSPPKNGGVGTISAVPSSPTNGGPETISAAPSSTDGGVGTISAAPSSATDGGPEQSALRPLRRTAAWGQSALRPRRRRTAVSPRRQSQPRPTLSAPSPRPEGWSSRSPRRGG